MMMPVRRLGMGRLGDQSITDIITQAAQAQGVPVSLALAQAQHESGMNPNAVGLLGEIGLFQLRPQYFAGQGDLTDPTINANVGLAYLQQQYQHTGNWNDALIAYNEGPTNWDNGLRTAKAVSYASSILAAAGIVAGGTTTPPAPAPVPAPAQVPVTQASPPPQPPPAGADFGTIALIAIAGLVAIEAFS